MVNCICIVGNERFGLSFHNGKGFSTYDRDVDSVSSGNCAFYYHGGWWYHSCAHVNLNGMYVTPGTESSHNEGEGGVIHRLFDGIKSLKSTEMKFRRT